MAGMLDAEQDELLAGWRAYALQVMPYFAPLMFAVRYRNQPGLGTWAVDANWNVLVDFDACKDNGTQWNAEALLHECCHLFQEHAKRFAHLRNQPSTGTLRNLATDFEVNPNLVNAGCTTLAADHDKGGVHPSMFGLPDHQSSEWYFDELSKRFPNPPQSQSSCGSGSGGTPVEGETDPNGLGADGVDEVTREATLLNTAAAIVAHNASRGNAPGGLLAAAEVKLLPPKVPWQRTLQGFVAHGAVLRSGKGRNTYRRRNFRFRPRLSDGQQLIMPGQVTTKPVVVMVRDTSGSVSAQMLSELSSEMVHLGQQLSLGPDNLLYCDVDTEATELAPLVNATHQLSQRRGNGGTDMRVGIEKALAANPDVVVVFTDGYTPWPDHPVPGVLLVACIVPMGSGTSPSAMAAVPDFIRAVAIED